MKKVSKKLELNRETLQSLVTDELAGVNGGAAAATSASGLTGLTPCNPSRLFPPICRTTTTTIA